jgi:hypothetical protein
MNEHINNKLYNNHRKTFPNYNSELDYNDKKFIHNELDNKIKYKHKRKSFSNLNELDNKIENKHRKTYPNQISENSILDNQYIEEYISIKKYNNNKKIIIKNYKIHNKYDDEYDNKYDKSEYNNEYDNKYNNEYEDPVTCETITRILVNKILKVLCYLGLLSCTIL